jgi:hypothetical protein
MDPASAGTEWLEDGRGAAVPLPELIYPTVERWVNPLINLIGKDVNRDDNDSAWDWDGNADDVARMLQAIVDDEINRAMLKLEQGIIKEFR